MAAISSIGAYRLASAGPSDKVPVGAIAATRVPASAWRMGYDKSDRLVEKTVSNFWSFWGPWAGQEPPVPVRARGHSGTRTGLNQPATQVVVHQPLRWILVLGGWGLHLRFLVCY